MSVTVPLQLDGIDLCVELGMGDGLLVVAPEGVGGRDGVEQQQKGENTGCRPYDALYLCLLHVLPLAAAGKRGGLPAPVFPDDPAATLQEFTSL